MRKAKVLTLLDTLRAAGAEQVAANLAVATGQSSEFFPMVCASRSGGELEAVLQAAGVEYRVLGRGHRFDVAPFFRLVRWIREEQIALIHSHMKGSNLWAGVIGRLSGIPVLAHAHGQPMGAADAVINAAVALLARRIVAVSERERSNLVQSPLVPGRKVVAVHNGLDATRYAVEAGASLRREFGFPDDAVVVGICAQLRPEKNHEIFLRAAHSIAGRSDRARFLIIGDGVRRQTLENLAADLNLDTRCAFAGHRSDVPELLKYLDIGVLTSKREGLPLVVLEYMTSGLPVVSTAVGGIPEAIRSDQNGFLVPVGDAEALADRIMKLIEAPELRKRFSSRGREIFDQSFSEQAMLDKIFSLYRELLAS